MYENTTKRMLDMLAKRSPQTLGLRKAFDFASVISPCLEDSTCAPNVFQLGDLTAWNLAIKRAERQLVWLDKDARVVSRYLHKLADAPTGEQIEPAAEQQSTLTTTPGALMDFEAVITTSTQDREKDVLLTSGADLDPMAPLLLQHLPTLNIGRHIKETFRDDTRLQGHLAIADTPLGNDGAVLVEFQALRISHGFVPEEVEEIPSPNGGDPSFKIIRFKILEVSLVSIPANSEAIVLAWSRNKLTHPIVKSWAAQLRKSLPAAIVGGFTSPEAPASERVTQPAGFRTKAAESCGGTCQHGKAIETRELPPPISVKGRTIAITKGKTVQSKERWNRSLSKAFDVAAANLEPSSLTYDWVSRYLGCPVKHVYQVSTTVASPRMGSWLTGLKNLLGPDYKLDDVRNISWDKECPPHYEVIQLNSRMSESFLVQGHAFYKGLRGKANLTLQFSPGWWGLDVTAYTSKDCSEEADKLLNDTWAWAVEHNFLKGEAFALSGEFLPKGNEKWEDLFLDPTNEKSVKKLVKRLNDKGKEFKNYGAIWSGPPGTGKTLSGRIMRNEIQDASFIWVSARDFYYAGAFGCLAMAYSLAKELSPAVVFIEDVDNWLDKYNVDYLKTELDGIGRSSGILTVLTTNFPEMMPEALIDRPGRFSDVLHFGLPGDAQRQAMLEKWLPGTDAQIITAAVQDTEGMSGAHIYHLAEYAKALEEDDGIERASSIVAALKKVAEQRELIDGIQLQGSHYRPTKEASFMVKTALPMQNKSSHGVAKQPQKPRKLKAAVAYAEAPTAEGEWNQQDALGRVSAWAGVDQAEVTDDAWEKYRQAFAWYDDALPKATGSYRLLHHDVQSDALVVVLGGVEEAMTTALASMSQQEIPDGSETPQTDNADWDAVYDHLAKHYAQFSKEPPAKAMKKVKATCPERDGTNLQDCPDAEASMLEQLDACKKCGAGLGDAWPAQPVASSDGKGMLPGFFRYDGKRWTQIPAVKALSKKRKGLLDTAQKLITTALAHDELKSAAVSRTLLEKAAVNVKEAMGDGMDGEENPEADDKPNPGIPNSDGSEKAAFALLVKMHKGERVEWDTLHALREAVEDAIAREDAAAADKVLASCV